MENLNIDFDHWRGEQIAQTIQSREDLMQDMVLISALKPAFSKDGNMYCFLYGELPNDCVVGFGETAILAARDFNNNFLNQKAVTP